LHHLIDFILFFYSSINTPFSAAWGGASCLSFNRGQHDESQPYLKSIILHQYLFGYELPDTIILLTENGMCYIFATKKKCEFLEPAVKYQPLPEGITGLKLLQKSKSGNDNESNFKVLLKAAGTSDVKMGVLLKESSYRKSDDTDTAEKKHDVAYSWEEAMDKTGKFEFVDVSAGLSLAMGPKDEEELDLLRKSSVLTNKVLKHGFIPKIEEVIDQEIKVTHEALASDMESIIEDPSKIKLKVPDEDVESCYFPIIQSGGNFDIKVSAQSSSDNVSYDIIMASLGARYKSYCSNVARTFLIDPPKFVSDTYETLVALQNACIEAFVPGRPLKAVYAAAVDYLISSGNEPLVAHLPKNLGFAIGLDFRDPHLIISAKNPAIIRPGMVFNLSIGFCESKLRLLCVPFFTYLLFTFLFVNSFSIMLS
jgi:nucleosome binding factor SPN SPT16 subunit